MNKTYQYYLKSPGLVTFYRVENGTKKVEGYFSSKNMWDISCYNIEDMSTIPSVTKLTLAQAHSLFPLLVPAPKKVKPPIKPPIKYYFNKKNVMTLVYRDDNGKHEYYSRNLRHWKPTNGIRNFSDKTEFTKLTVKHLLGMFCE